MLVEIQKPHAYRLTLKGFQKIDRVFNLIKSNGLISIDDIKKETELSHFEVVDFCLGYLLHSGHITQYSEGFSPLKSTVEITINV